MSRWTRFIMGRVWRLLVLLGALGLSLDGLAAQQQRALLVGVSALVHQPPSLWLQAPRNDVTLMRQALLGQGWSAADIVTLADGVPGAELPDLDRIRSALQDLLDRSSSGDLALLYFSGHGTRWRDPDKPYEEPDSLAEVFLTREVQGRQGGAVAPQGGLRDVEFEAWIDAFQAKNVFVWSVFDTCAATSMTRSGRGAGAAVQGDDGSDEVRFRGVRATELRHGRQAPASADAPPVPAGGRVPRARYVAFFASESHQLTPELKLPRGARDAQPQGLLTWTLVETLKRQPATWRELFNGMLSLYPPVIDELERRFPAHELPSPVAEGVLDAPLWRNAASPRTTAPHWLARQSRSSLLVAAGQLDGARPGLAVLATARSADGQVRELRTHIETADLVSARISLPASLAAPDAGNWRVVPQEPPADAVLRVSGEVGAIAGLNLEFPASIAPVLEGAADLRIERRGHGFAVMTAAGAEIALDNQAALNRYLGSAATLKWLDQLVARAHGHRIDGFSVEVLSLAGDGQALRAQPVQGAMGDAPWLAAGEQAAVEVSNLSGRSVDLLIMGVDARGQVYPIYPPSSAETNRFESGRPARPSGKRFVLPAPLMRPGGRLLVLAAPARALSAPRLFGAAPVHEPADGLVRGQAAALPEGAVHAASLHW